MSVSGRVRKRFPHLLAAPVGLAALLSANGVAHVVLARLAPTARQLASAAGTEPRARPAFHSTSAAAILARNPFDSTRPRAEPAVADDGANDPELAPTCGGVKVVAIVASAEDPDWSFAALQVGAEPPLLRRRGGDVADKTIVYIAPERVWMSDSGHLCHTSMFAPRVEAVAATPDAGAPIPQPGNALEASIVKNIRRKGATDFEMDRSVVERVLENQAEILGRTRVGLEKDGSGRVLGVRLSNILPGGVLDALGIQNGDRLKTINGYDVTNPSSALEALARLQQADRLTLVLDRKGAPTTLDYAIK